MADILCDLGLVPIVIRDAFGAGHAESVERALDDIALMGDAILRSVEEIVSEMGH